MQQGRQRPVPTWAPETFLGSLPAAVTQELLRLSVQRAVPPGQVMIREGGDDTHVELIVSGFVKVTTSVDGIESLLSIRLPGDLIGEIGALTPASRTATVTACGRVIAGVIPRVTFEDFLRRHPAASLRVTAAVAEQLRWANRRRIDFAVFPADVRLARVLVEIAQICGRPTPQGGVAIGVPLSQPELATMIAVSQATVHKAIFELRRRGLLSTGYRRLTILDLGGLRRVAQPSEA